VKHNIYILLSSTRVFGNSAITPFLGGLGFTVLNGNLKLKFQTGTFILVVCENCQQCTGNHRFVKGLVLVSVFVLSTAGRTNVIK